LVDIGETCLVRYFGHETEVIIEQGIEAIAAGCFCWLSLRSISIPSSVETIGTHCFAGTRLSNLTFEPGSRLSALGDFAFQDCSTLQSICLPASLRQLTGLAVARSWIKAVIIDPGNRYFRLAGEYLVDIGETCLVRYWGHQEEVVIGKDIEAIAAGCFEGRHSLSLVQFEHGCRISSFGEYAFCSCTSLQSICIPSSVQIIPEFCFNNCGHLSTLTFEPGCRISSFGKFAFSECSSLESISIPSSVETILQSCFKRCDSLSEVTFESGSQLSVLGDFAFQDCPLLQSIRLPSLTETISDSCFAESPNLRTVILEAGCCRLSDESVSLLASRYEVLSDVSRLVSAGEDGP
jgi:hypothetical protein